MKKYYQIALVALVCLFSFQVTACADNDKPIDFTQLPTAAQQLVKKYFPTQKVAATTVESGLLQKSYDVVFASTDKSSTAKAIGQKSVVASRPFPLP